MNSVDLFCIFQPACGVVFSLAYKVPRVRIHDWIFDPLKTYAVGFNRFTYFFEFAFAYVWLCLRIYPNSVCCFRPCYETFNNYIDKLFDFFTFIIHGTSSDATF